MQISCYVRANRLSVIATNAPIITSSFVEPNVPLQKNRILQSIFELEYSNIAFFECVRIRLFRKATFFEDN